jgi:hypothetical protein
MIVNEKIKDQSIKERFLDLQREVIPHLTKEEREKYKTEIQLIEGMNDKLDYVRGWNNKLQQRIQIKETFFYIKENFPEEIDSIKLKLKRMRYEEEILSFLQNRLITLKEAKKLELKRKCLNLRAELKEKVDRETFFGIKEELKSIDLIENQYRYLKEQYSKF